MKLSLLMAIMHVMGRLGLWKPYLWWIQKWIDYLDQACEEEFGPFWDEGLYDVEEGAVVTYG